MPEATFVQRAFNGGEISPWAEGRTDVQSYRAASRTIENFIPTPQGGLVRRPGTRYVTTLTSEARLIQFVISRSDAYTVVLENYRMRFIRSGGVLNYSDASVDALDIDPTADQVMALDHGFYHGQTIRLLSTGAVPTGVSTATDYYVVLPRAIPCTQQVGATYTSIGNHNLRVGMGPYRRRADDNGSKREDSEYWIAAIPTATTFTLTPEKGTAAPAVTTGSSGFVTLVPTEEAIRDTFRLSTQFDALEANVVNITAKGTGPHVFGTQNDEAVVLRTPWSLAQVWELDFTQDESTLYFFHKDHRPWELRRFNTSAFRLVPFDLEHGPYGDVAPAGLGAELQINTTLVANEYQNVVDFECDSGHFQGTHVGTSVRKGYNGTSNNTINRSIIGTIERVRDHYAHVLELSGEYVDRPTSNQWSVTGHGFIANEPVCFIPGKGLYPTELSERTVYYIRYIDANTFELATTSGGGTMTLTDPGSGSDHFFVSCYLGTVDEDGASATHPFLDGDGNAGVFGLGELPLGLDMGREYVVRVVDTTTIYLETPDGSVAPIASRGSGRFFVSAGPKATNVDVRITVDARGTGVTAGVSEGATLEWFDSAWNGRDGWPSKGTFHQQRLVCANSNEHTETVWVSASGDTTDFSFDTRQAADLEDLDRQVTDASGWSYRILGGRTGAIQWLHNGVLLIAGAESAIAALTASSNREALTASNVNAEIRQRSGVSDVKPVDALGDAVFESYAQRAMQAAVFDGNAGTFAMDDIALLAEHVHATPAKQLAWQSEPYGIVYLLRDDGSLWASTYSSRQGLAAWHRWTLGGVDVAIESISVVPETDELGRRYERLYLSVMRTVDGGSVRFLEYLDSPLHASDDADSAYYVDAGIVYDGGSTSTITGLDHLEGETVRVWADGAAQADKVVASGQITLDAAASVVSCGLPYVSRWESLPFEAGLDGETTIQGLRSRIVDAQLRLYRSIGGEIGPRLTKLYDIDYRRPSHAMDTPIPLFTGLIGFPSGAGYGNEATLALKVDTASPFHLVAITARIEWVERS